MQGWCSGLRVGNGHSKSRYWKDCELCIVVVRMETLRMAPLLLLRVRSNTERKEKSLGL